MFWRMTGLSAASPVEAILDRENYTLEELLDEDEIIQECKALNTRLINFLRERTQVEQLLRYIVEETPDDDEKKRVFKFPFIACEIFTCEIDIILKTLVEDEELMNILFSFLKPEHSHSALLAGYFSKVVICLILRKTVPLMNYVQAHQEIFRQLIDLIGITSIMEVLIRLIGADEHVYSNYMSEMQWLEETNVLELIADRFSLSDSPEVHANAAEILCAITRCAPSGLAAKISSPSFVGKLLHHALEESRPKSVLVHSLTICISLLDPKRSLVTPYYSFRIQKTHGPSVIANPEAVDGMLQSIGDLLKLLDVSYPESVLLTPYGSLEPPLGKHRLKIVELISVLLGTGIEAVEKELIRLGAIRTIIDLFFKYPFNNFLHHHVENIIMSCLESKGTSIIEHLLQDCDIVSKILAAEKNFTLITDSTKPTMPAQGRCPPRIGNIGHITRIANKLIQLGNNISIIQTQLQDNGDWVEWHANILLKRNAVENVYQWACGRPAQLLDRNRDSDDDFRDTDYDMAALANNLSQAFRYGMYSNDTIEEVHGSLEREDEGVYFDDKSAEVAISSLHLGDEKASSLFTNSNWFAFDGDQVSNECSTSLLGSKSPTFDETDNVVVGDSDGVIDPATSSEVAEEDASLAKPGPKVSENDPADESKVEFRQSSLPKCEKPPEWVEWRETLGTSELPDNDSTPSVPNCEAVTDFQTAEGDDVYETLPLQEGEDGVNEDAKESPGMSDAGMMAESAGNSPGDCPCMHSEVSSTHGPSSVQHPELVGSKDAVETVEPKREVGNGDDK